MLKQFQVGKQINISQMLIQLFEITNLPKFQFFNLSFF